MPHALLLYAPGTNCDQETAFALKKVGFTVDYHYIDNLVRTPDTLRRYELLVLPGGFTYGDDIASGKVLALKLKRYLKSEIETFIQAGKLILGICNGFQVLVKSNILGDGKVSLVTNLSGHFECRWVHLKSTTHKCVFTKGLDVFDLPVAHAEGRLVGDTSYIEDLEHRNEIALKYVDEHGNPTMEYPHNPNGSLHAIAGITDRTGRVLGLMPHPERFIFRYQHPSWNIATTDPVGIRFFVNAYEYIKHNL